jgi:hypothetical protein
MERSGDRRVSILEDHKETKAKGTQEESSLIGYDNRSISKRSVKFDTLMFCPKR